MLSVLRHASVSKVDEIHSNGRIVGCSMSLVLVGIVPVIGEDGVCYQVMRIGMSWAEVQFVTGTCCRVERRGRAEWRPGW